MATFRVNNVIIETSYNKYANKWFAKVYDQTRCYYKARLLREGIYPFFNGVTAKIDYGNSPPNAPLDIYEPNIEFVASCQVIRGTFEPCATCI